MKRLEDRVLRRRALRDDEAPLAALRIASIAMKMRGLRFGLPR